MFRFHIDPELDTLFENLTGRIGAWPGFGIHFCFESPIDLWIDIVKMQQLTLLWSVCPFGNGLRLFNSQLAIQKIITGCI